MRETKKVPHLNADLAFLEEFGWHDDRSSRGREGYALVTLRAAVTFLNESRDIGRDLFGIGVVDG